MLDRCRRRRVRAAIACVSAGAMTTACGGSAEGDAASVSATPAAPAVTLGISTMSVPPTATGTATIQRATATSMVAPERVPLAVEQEVETGGGPGILAATDDALWIELHRASHLARLDPESMTVELLPDVPAHCFISAAAGVVWTTIHRENLVTRTDAETGVTTLIEMPHACGLEATDDEVWITDPDDGLVHRLDPNTGDVVQTIDVPEAPFTLSAVGDVLFATGEGDGGWLSVIDVATGAIEHNHTWPEITRLDDMASGFGAVWATGRGDPRLFELDPATGDVIATIDVGGKPSGIAAGEDALWITLLDGDLVRVDPIAGQITGAWTSEYTWLTSPVLAFGSLWMTSLDQNVVIRVDPATLEAT
jgi:streptogramin lyase